MARRITSPVLVGRDAELRAFELALEEARDERSRLIILGGEAGAGKTRLVAEFAARTRATGGTAVVGSAPPPAGEGRAPFAALAPALRGLVRSLDARLIDRWLGSARGDLAALLPELGSAPPPSAEHDPFASTRLAEAVLVAIEAAARQRPPVLIALEDLHWADDATWGIVTYAARNLVRAPLVLLVTYRSDASGADEPLDAFLAELQRFPGAERLELGALEPDAVARQARAILGSDPETQVMQALVRRSSGNPFFVEELLAAIIQGGVERLPPSVRTMVEARLGRLGPASRVLVETAAVAGADVPVELLARATSLSLADFDAALREAREAHLITPLRAGPEVQPAPGDPAEERIGMRHVLVREVIVEALSPPRRRELHALLAAVIRSDRGLAGSSELERAARLAEHLLLAGQAVEAIPVLIGEAVAAEEARGFETAAQAYQRALSLWRPLVARDGPAGDGPLAGLDLGHVLERAAQSASLAGAASQAVALAEEALAAARPADPPEERERIVRLRMHLGRYQAEAGQREAALATLETAHAEAPVGSLLRARCATALARQLVLVHRHEEAAELAAAAAADAEAARGRAEAGQARATQALALARLGRLPEALAALRAAPAVARRGERTTATARPSRYAAAVHGSLDRALVLEGAGDPGAAAQAALEGRLEAERHGLSPSLHGLLSALAARDLLRTGAWDEAARILVPPSGEPASPVPEAALVRALLATWRGDWSAAETDLDRVSAARVPEEGGWSTFRDLVEAELACWRRRFAEARAALWQGIERAEAEADRANLAHLALLGVRVEADAVAASTRRGVTLSASSEESATVHWIRLRAALEQAPDAATHADRDVALLATGAAEFGRLRHGPGLDDAWQRAVDSWDRSGDGYAAAYARWRLAEVLLAGGGDRGRARRALEEALSIADDLAAEPLALEIERLARRARLSGLGSDQRQMPESLSPAEAHARRMGLSEREIEVLKLLAEGMPDRDIGQRLFITTKTTGHHVSHILGKLGVDRRGEAAAIAFRIGLLAPGG